MDRPARVRKAVNYNDFQDNDDEDFAVKAPACKKPRHDVDKSKRQTVNSGSQENKPGRKERVSLAEKAFDRDLEAALTLSLLQSNAETNAVELSADRNDIQNSPPQLINYSIDTNKCVDEINIHNSPPRLTNCSVDANNHGLNDITNEPQAQSNSAMQRKAASKATTSLKEQKKLAADDDYLPQNTPESPSESDFSGDSESEDEEFTVKKGSKKIKQNKSKKKAAQKEKQTQKPSTVKPKQQTLPTGLPTKDSSLTNPTLNRSPVPTKPVISRSPVPTKAASTQKKNPTTPPTSRSVQSASPLGGSKVPKWNPPGQIGRSPGSSPGIAVKSPSQGGLRLGLSRLARVKPLHPNAAAH